MWTLLHTWFPMSGLLKYFKPLSRSTLPDQNGKFSRTAPSNSITVANQEASTILVVAGGNNCKDSAQSIATSSTTRGPYAKFTPKQKATVGNYAVSNGTSATLWHFKTEFPELKWSTVNNWKNAIIKNKRVINRDEESVVVELVGKKRVAMPTRLLRTLHCP